MLAAAAMGEFKRFHPQAVSRNAWLALVYLIVAGSIVAFTAYVWLIHHESPTKVGTYAYVNPVVAVALGYFFGGEAVELRTLLGTLLVLVSVVVITTTPKSKLERGPLVKEVELADRDEDGIRHTDRIPTGASSSRASSADRTLRPSDA